MKLLKVIMYNLASLEGEQVIDFESEPLRSADLFSIVGETGSGKSTILDAVCLALYGLAPRFYGADNFDYYHTERPNNDQVLDPDDPRNILRKGTKECFAEVMFLARDGFRYRARWSCSIARINYTRPERRLYRITVDEAGRTSEKEVDITGGGRPKRGHKNINNEGLDRIIGLDYAQFTRTVMLAQNSFANFVKADDKDKAVLLEKLTGTELYTAVARKIYEFYKEAEAAYNEVFNQVKAFAVHQLSDEKLAEVEAYKEELDARFRSLQTELQKLKDQQKWYADLCALEVAFADEEAKWKQASEKAQSLQSVRDELRLLDEVAPIRDVYQTCMNLQRELKELTEEVGRKQLQCSALEKEEAEKRKLLLDVKENYNVAREKQEQMLPLVTEARKQKVELDAQQATVTRLKEEESSLAKKEELLKKEQAENAAQIGELQKRQAEAERILAQLMPHRDMLENKNAVSDRLESLDKAVKRWQKESADWKKNCVELENQQQACREEENRLQKSDEELVLCRENIQQKTQALAGVDVEALQQRMADVTKCYTDLERLRKLQAAVTERRKSLSANRLASEQIAKELDAAMREVKELTTEREEINRLLPGLEEAWQLASSRSAEHMRAALKPGEPCPVCGAREHPYAEGIAEVLQPVKEEIARRRKRLTEIEGRLDASPGGLRLLCSELNGKLSALREGTGRLNAELTEAVGEWTALVVAYPVLPVDVVQADASVLSALLTTETDRIVAQGKQARAEQNAYQQAQNELTAMRRTYDEKQALCSRQREELHRQAAELKQRQGQSEQKRAELQQLERTNGELREALRQDVSLPDWEQAFEQDFEGLLNRLSDMYDKYREATRVQQESVGLLNERKVAAGALEKQLAECQAAVKENKEEIAGAVQIYEAKQKSYMQVLGDADPDETERKLKLQLEEAEKQVQLADKAHNEVVESYSRLSGFVKAAEEQYRKKQADGTIAQAGVDDFITRYNETAEHTDVLSKERLDMCFSPSVDWSGKREQIRQADENVKWCQGQMEARRKVLETHRALQVIPLELLGEECHPAEMLQEKMQQVQASSEELDKERLQVGGMLMAHRRSMEQMQSVGEELERRRKAYQDWKELNDILGNANGDKFRETAQCFTLRFLIRQANEQLRLLNHRYSLEQVKDSLGIRVIDHDRADEVRNISSLSGGETFLISLALALGLSSLSSRNIPMCNLFVDEGFGTLDTNSLNMVIDALSSLQSMQGKKVGVISHTAEMRERIRTQIRVVKVGSGGKSTIEIV